MATKYIVAVLIASLLFIMTNTARALPFVDGTVFRDFNYNGLQEPAINEPGVAGIQVFVYLEDGTTPIAAATTDATGSYVIDLATATVTVNTGDPLRVEFQIPAPLDNYLIPGRHNGAATGGQATTVRFVDAYADTALQDINLALVNPTDYCHTTNPDLAVSCYAFGAQTAGDPVLVEFPYESGTTLTNAAADSAAADVSGIYNVLALDNQMGAVWGTAYRRRSDDLFLGSFARRHSDYRPGGGPGEIHRVDRSTGTVSVFATLPAGTNNHDTTDYVGDNPFWNDVGTVGLGDIDISDNEATLFAVNLFDRRIYSIDIASGNITSSAIPLPGSCAADFVRPGALKFKDGALYIGLTCTGPTDADLRAYVYRNGNEVVNFPLDYGRGQTSRDDGAGSPNEADWRAWVTTETSIPLAFGAFHYPQPWLLDIEFDENNFMIASVADRFGYQAGNDQSGAGNIEGVSAGDILRLSPNGTTFADGLNGWDIEANASDGVNATGGAGNGQGPGGGEFYFQDQFAIGGGRDGLHQETTLAGLATVLGSNEVVSPAFDPAPRGDVRTGGLIYHSNITGGRTRSIEVFQEDQPGTFGKAAGTGDIEALCGPAPLEIGNYVWFDEDRDGVQDPDDPIGGVIVSLYIDHDNDPTTDVLLVAQTTTDGSGHYYFNETNIPATVDFDGSGTAGDNPNEIMFFDIDGDGAQDPNEPGGILPLTTYEVRIDDTANFAAAGPLFEFYSTAVLAGGNNEITQDVDGNYRRDSNGQNTTTGDFVTATNFVTTNTFTVGDFGSNDHTFDFGFSNVQPVPTETPTPTPTETPLPTDTPTPTPTSTPTLPPTSTVPSPLLTTTPVEVRNGTPVIIIGGGTPVVIVNGTPFNIEGTPLPFIDVALLPETGEPPGWRMPVLLLSILMLGMGMVGTIRFLARQKA